MGDTGAKAPVYISMNNKVKATKTYMHDGNIVVCGQVFLTEKADELIRGELAVEVVEEKTVPKRKKEKDGGH